MRVANHGALVVDVAVGLAVDDTSLLSAIAAEATSPMPKMPDAKV